MSTSTPEDQLLTQTRKGDLKDLRVGVNSMSELVDDGRAERI